MQKETECAMKEGNNTMSNISKPDYIKKTS